MQEKIKLVECPRDAMQGWKTPIDTTSKIAYINALLQVGFDTLDCGSFVSAKAIPQMADTATVLRQISMDGSNTKLLCIIANERGAAEACTHENISYLGFPFSLSPTFQVRNTNSTIEQSWQRLLSIHNTCIKNNKELVVYLSMGFGNPYGDVYNKAIVFEWTQKLADAGIQIISVADTVGLATPSQVSDLMQALVPMHPNIEIGVHLHSSPINWQQKIEAAFSAGCIRFDGALKGIGGCPMANDELVGNMDTELMVNFFRQKALVPQLDLQALSAASAMAPQIFQ